MTLKSSNSASEFAVNAGEDFIQAEFTDKEKFVSLSKAVMIGS